MNTYISHASAAFLWNIPYIEAVLGCKSKTTVDITISQPNALWATKNRKIHLCQTALPAGAVVSKNGELVSSPELIFLQLACQLSPHQLMLLGLQLCSHPPGNPSAALTTKKRLRNFLTKTSGHHGHKKACQVIRYLENGSASIMESMVYLILTLPNAFGGYGLSGADFNYEITLKERAGQQIGQKRCFADLYYKSAKLAVEYDSFAFHSTPAQQGKDGLRSTLLERQGIEVMRLTTLQLYDKAASMDFALNLASRLGKRIQIRAKRFDWMHGLLRTLLPIRKPAS